MTLGDARRTLRGRLWFGDEAQIRARKFIEQVELAKDAIEECEEDHAEAQTVEPTIWKNVWYEEIVKCKCVAKIDEQVRAEAALDFVRIHWRY
jgi:hypothetical protein